VDGNEVIIPELMSKCLGGEGPVPKLFFFDCSRGNSLETRQPQRNRLGFDLLLRCNPHGLSAMADCLACFATEEGEFTKGLCKRIEELAEYGEQNGERDIEDALKLAGAEVALKRLGLCRRQSPAYESTLTRRFILRNARTAGRPSSSLTITTTPSCTYLAGSSSSSLL